VQRFFRFRVALAIMSAWVSISLAAGQLVLPIADKKGPSPFRELTGQVMNKADAPLANVVVYLKNTKTLAVRTFITGADGNYRFPALDKNVDYDIFAEYQGKRSGAKTLSAFDSRDLVHINLRIDAR